MISLRWKSYLCSSCTFNLLFIAVLVTACSETSAQVVTNSTGQQAQRTDRAAVASKQFSHAEVKTEMTELARKLINLGYENLFLQLDDTNLDALWSEPSVPQALETLAVNPNAPTEARFLAAEILFSKRSDYPAKNVREQLASVYAAALSQAELGNPWGLPGELDGSAGKHFVQLGETAVIVLIPLLTDNRQVLYGGSKEATFGNSYEYRVKDFAAFYISKIRNLPYVVHEKPEARDAEIEKLRSSL